MPANSVARFQNRRVDSCSPELRAGREESGYPALCPEYDIASQAATIEEARDNLVEALRLFFESAAHRPCLFC